MVDFVLIGHMVWILIKLLFLVAVMLVFVIKFIKSPKCEGGNVIGGKEMRKIKKTEDKDNKCMENPNIENNISKETMGKTSKKAKNKDFMVKENITQSLQAPQVTESASFEKNENKVAVENNNKYKKYRSISKLILQVAEVLDIEADKKYKKKDILEKILQISSMQKERVLWLNDKCENLEMTCQRYYEQLNEANEQRIKENNNCRVELTSLNNALEEQEKKSIKIFEEKELYKSRLDDSNRKLAESMEDLKSQKKISDERLSEINKLKAEYERKFAEKTCEIEEQRANYKKKCEELMAEAFQCQDNPQARRLLAEKIDNMEQNLEALSKIENVCLYIDQYSNYEELKKQVNRIKSILNDFHANEK